MTGLYLVIFGWCVWTGVDLWQGKPQGYKWAKVLFAAQIPVITFPGFTYHFEVGGLVIQFPGAKPGENQLSCRVIAQHLRLSGHPRRGVGRKFCGDFRVGLSDAGTFTEVCAVERQGLSYLKLGVLTSHSSRRNTQENQYRRAVRLIAATTLLPARDGTWNG